MEQAKRHSGHVHIRRSHKPRRRSRQWSNLRVAMQALGLKAGVGACAQSLLGQRADRRALDWCNDRMLRDIGVHRDDCERSRNRYLQLPKDQPDRRLMRGGTTKPSGRI